jgi:hypothetical protein
MLVALQQICIGNVDLYTLKVLFYCKYLLKLPYLIGSTWVEQTHFGSLICNFVTNPEKLKL